MTKINNYELIECVVPYQSGATRFTFNDQPQLRFVNTLAISTYYDTSLRRSPLSNNKTPFFTEFINASIVLYYDDKEAVDRMPVSALNNIQGNGIFDRAAFAGQTIVWAKSYLAFGQPIQNWGNYTGPISFMFGVYYA